MTHHRCGTLDYGDRDSHESPVCRDCGQPISEGHERCRSCAALHRISHGNDYTRVRNHKVRVWWTSTASAMIERVFLAELHLEVARAVKAVRSDRDQAA